MKNLIEYYEDKDNTLADIMLNIFKSGVESHEIKSDIGNLVVNVNTVTRKVDVKSVSDLVDETNHINWTSDMMFKKYSFLTKVNVEVSIFADNRNLVTFKTWFAQKNSSHSDACLGPIFFERNRLSTQVEAEWHFTLQDWDGEIPEGAKTNSLGLMLKMDRHCKKLNEKTIDDLTLMLKDVKVA